MQFDKPRNLFSCHFAVTMLSVHHPGRKHEYGRLWKAILIIENETALKICFLNINLGPSKEQTLF